jgi:transposase-like protein
MATGRRRHSSEFKAKVALEALKGHKTLNELASEYSVHPVQIAQWKRQAQEGLVGVFESPSSRRERADEALVEQLYQQIGQLKVELDWLRKKGRPWPGRDRAGGSGGG